MYSKVNLILVNKDNGNRVLHELFNAADKASKQLRKTKKVNWILLKVPRHRIGDPLFCNSLSTAPASLIK